MSEELNLSMHRHGPRDRKPSGAVFLILLILLIVVSGLNSLLLLGKIGGGKDVRGDLSRGDLEDLALKLEKQSLPGAAARAWIDYLESAAPGKEERARIWYRIGKIRQGSGDHEGALEAYYRSESLAGIDEIAGEISRRTAECLEKLGKFAALRYELEGRTSFSEIDSTGGGDVIAEIGSWKISRAELEMMVETEIDLQLAQLAPGLTPEERIAQKEKLLDGILKQGGRERWLETFIAEELLYRSAREGKLHEEQEFRSLSRNIERKLLAQRRLEREYAARITIAPDELQDYYNANIKEFEEDGVQKPFDEVKNEVYSRVRLKKEMEIQGQVLERLKRQYDVVIHYSRLGKN